MVRRGQGRCWDVAREGCGLGSGSNDRGSRDVAGKGLVVVVMV